MKSSHCDNSTCVICRDYTKQVLPAYQILEPEMKEFRIDEGTLQLVKEKLTGLREATNSRSEYIELKTLLTVLEKLTPFTEPAPTVEDKLKEYGKVVDEYIRTHAYPPNFLNDIIKRSLPTQTAQSSLVGKRIEHPYLSFMGTILQELPNDKVLMVWDGLLGEHRWVKSSLGL